MSIFLLHTMKVKVPVEFRDSVAISSIDCWRDGTRGFHSGVGELTTCGLCTFSMQVQPQICLAPWRSALTSHSQSRLSFISPIIVTTSSVLFLFSRGLHLLSTPANSINCKYLLRVKTAGSKQ